MKHKNKNKKISQVKKTPQEKDVSKKTQKSSLLKNLKSNVHPRHKKIKNKKGDFLKSSQIINKGIKPSSLEHFPNIKVIGVGGAGGNILSRMKQAKIQGVEFIVVNTDLQDLYKSGIRKKIHIGKNIAHGMGSGMNPEIGRQAAEESRPQLEEAIKGADMVFLTCGLGGGTGSGATPVIADICQQMGILTVAIVTKPFSFEGIKRTQIAEEALLKLKDKVDSYIVIPNDRIFNLIDQTTPLYKAFELIDEILKQAVKGIGDLILSPGIINVDFSDVRTILQNAGMSLIGLGRASGEDRAVKAVKEALNSPLFEYSPHMAKGVLFNVIGDSGLTMTEINEAARLITEVVDPSAKIIFGAMENQRIKKGEIKIMIIAAGFEYSNKFPAHSPFVSSEKNEIKRNNNQQPPIEFKEESAPSLGESLEDIPAFLRKKKK
ncbi:MAG TPA: cell division protein FtsZ [Candidatus Paceibacterota bacterium]|nr:cell division protein FtsZ [Candidatus Paceibacterota bacterium]HQM34869.1 cell division protein FtsZ [Candidatus Paceibacterota bacterium]